MTRSWLNQVLVVTVVAAGSLPASVGADNKGPRISGGSFRASGGGSPGGSVSRGSVAPRATGNLGGVSGGGFRPPTSRVIPNSGGNLGSQALNKGNVLTKPAVSVLPKPLVQVAPKPLAPLGLKLPIVGGGGSNGGVKINPILGGKVGGIALGPKSPGVGPAIAPKVAGIVAGGCFPGGNPHCEPCNPFQPGVHPWWWCPAWVAPAPTPCYPVVYTQPIVVPVSVPAAVPVAESAPAAGPSATTTPEEKLLQVPLGATLTLQATGLGERAGQVIVQIEKIAMPALVSEWTPDSVTATLPTVAISENLHGELLLMKADGQLASSVKVELTPALPPVVEETKLAGDPTFALPTSLNP